MEEIIMREEFATNPGKYECGRGTRVNGRSVVHKKRKQKSP